LVKILISGKQSSKDTRKVLWF